MSKGLHPLELQIPLLAAQQAGANMYGSPRLNLFSLLKPSETALSRVLADLLDIEGTHGQGTLFLNEFCRIAALPPVSLRDRVKVTREARANERRRIDILVETPAIIFGIENKPWAEQQPNQLADYLTELKTRARGRKAALIFISGQIEKSAQGEVIKLPLAGGTGETASLASSLVSISHRIRSDRTRRLINDFIAYLEWEFADVPFVADLEVYSDAVLAEFAREGDRRQAVAAVMLTVDRLWNLVVDDIGEYLLSRARAQVAPDFEAGRKSGLSEYLSQKYNPWPLRRPSWPTNCTVSLESEQNDARSLFVGVKAPDPTNRLVQKEHGSVARSRLGSLGKVISGGRTSAWWPWYQPLEFGLHDYDQIARLVLEAPKGDVSQHPAIQQLGDLIVELAQAVDSQLQ